MAFTELRAAAQQAQPEALRLADALEMSSNHGIRRDAAAELRRLHAERTAADGVINDLAAKVRGLQTQSGALLEALELGYDSAKAGADQYHAAMAGYRPQRHAEMDAEVQQIAAAITALKTALAEPTVKESLQVPAEVAATMTTTDIAWLATCRLTKLWQELGQMRWAGADEGWDRAIEAVRSRLNDECQSVLDWKAKADQSQATAVELLRKMQGVKDD